MTALLTVSWVGGEDSHRGGRLLARWGGPPLVAPRGVLAPRGGGVSAVKTPDRIASIGWDSARFTPRYTVIWRAGDYFAYDTTLHPEGWAVAVRLVAGVLKASWEPAAAGLTCAPVGVDCQVFGAAVVTRPTSVGALGFNALYAGYPFIADPKNYIPSWRVRDGRWVAATMRGPQGSVSARWTLHPEQLVTAYALPSPPRPPAPQLWRARIVPAPFDALSTATPHVSSRKSLSVQWPAATYSPEIGKASGVWGTYSGGVVRPQGVPPAAVGTPVVETARALLPTGFYTLGVGLAAVESRRKVLRPHGIAPPAAATLPAIWNWRQYRTAQGFVSQVFGPVYVRGGVKHVIPPGLLATQYGSATIADPHAARALLPKSIEALGVPQPSVSPRILYPVGIYGTGFSYPLVQFPPRPTGWDSSIFGVAKVRDKASYLRPQGPPAPDPGFPRVADRAKRILHIASPVSTVFGDIQARLLNARVSVHGIDAAELSVWAGVRNRNRYVTLVGVTAPPVGMPNFWQTPSFAPAGFDACRFGMHDVGFPIRAVYPGGIRSPDVAVPRPSLWQTPALQPLGLAALVIPLPTVQNGRRYLLAAGATMQALGKPSVSFRYRSIAPQGGDLLQVGTLRLEHGNRALQMAGFRDDAYGAPALTFRVRTLEPKAIKPPEGGTRHMVGGTRWLRPDGYVATRWGTRIIPEAQVLLPLGFAGTFGWPALHNHRQYLRPDSIRLYAEPQQYLGLNRIHNARQYISMAFDPDSDLNPPRWPSWTRIENRNRRSNATGWVASVVAVPLVRNNARPLLPVGAEPPNPPSWYKAGMVAPRIRPLRLEGLEPPYLSAWGNVRNVARLLRPMGVEAVAFGLSAIQNRSRAFDRIGGFDSAWYGYPFVAPRIRELTFEGRYTIGAPRINLPSVHLHVRYVEAASIPPREVGRASTEVHWNLIAPRWTMIGRWGEPRVKNLTPELPMRGYPMDEWGQATVRLQWRELRPTGERAELFGRTIIADSRRSLFPSGLLASRIGDKLTVVKTGVPPLGTQFIWLDSLDPITQPNAGHGIPTPNYPDTAFGKPHMQQQVIYPTGIDPANPMLFGIATVTANSIRVEPGIFELTVGGPAVGLKRRSVAPGGFQTHADGMPRVSPYTIYAVVEAPGQAQVNHPTPSTPHYVNARVVFGDAVVQNQNRWLGQHDPWNGPQGFLRFGSPGVANSRQVVSAEGRSMLRLGWVTIPGVVVLEVQTVPPIMPAGGIPAVMRPPYTGPQTIKATGFVAALFPGFQSPHAIEHRDRAVCPVGADMLQAGAGKDEDTPFMWQGLRVGSLVPNIPEGIDATAIGTCWISLRVRQAAIEGFDAFICEYDDRAFDQRMRVRHGTTNERPRQVVSAHGWRSAAHAAHGVRAGRHYIRPDGNSDQHRKGAPTT